MAQYSSVDLLTLKGLVKTNEIDTKIVSPNTTGDTEKIDASDHNEVDTAILDLLGHTMQSTYNKVDGIELADIVEGDTNGQMLVWDTTTSTWLLSTEIGATPAGDLHEVQMKGVGNTFSSSSSFTYNPDDSEFTVTDSTFTVAESVSKFTLPAASGNSFLITGDSTEIDNYVEINTEDNTINIGAEDTIITLRRGASILDENLKLEAETLTLDNANLIVKTPVNVNTPAFSLTNSSNQNLITYNNDGTISRNVNFTSVSGSTSLTNKSTVLNITNFTGEERVSINNDSYTFNPGASTTLTTLNNTVFSQSTSNVNAGLAGYIMQFNNVNRAVGFWSNAMFMTGGSARGNQNPSVNNGYAYMSSNENVGLEAKRIIKIDGTDNTTEINSLLRLKRGPSSGVANFLTILTDVGGGVALDFEIGYAGRSDGLGIGQLSSLSDRIGSRIAKLSDPDSPATSELFFETTENGVNVTPLLLTGKDVKIGYADGKQGFYGITPIAKQDLPLNPTNAELATVLANLGLVNLI